LHIKVTFVQWLVAWQQDSQACCSVGKAEYYDATTGTVNPHHGQLYVACTGAGSAQDVYMCVPTRHTHDAVLSGRSLNAVLPQGHGNFFLSAEQI